MELSKTSWFALNRFSRPSGINSTWYSLSGKMSMSLPGSVPLIIVTGEFIKLLLVVTAIVFPVLICLWCIGRDAR